MHPGKKPEEVYLNLVMQYVPETLHRSIRAHAKATKYIPMMYVKVRFMCVCAVCVCVCVMCMCASTPSLCSSSLSLVRRCTCTR
jgi:uncharacterized membrane protein YecN with MAPEG domain